MARRKKAEGGGSRREARRASHDTVISDAKTEQDRLLAQVEAKVQAGESPQALLAKIRRIERRQ